MRAPGSSAAGRMITSRNPATGSVVFETASAGPAELEAPFGGVEESGNGFAEGGDYVYAALTELQAVYSHELAS